MAKRQLKNGADPGTHTVLGADAVADSARDYFARAVADIRIPPMPAALRSRTGDLGSCTPSRVIRGPKLHSPWRGCIPAAAALALLFFTAAIPSRDAKPDFHVNKGALRLLQDQSVHDSLRRSAQQTAVWLAQSIPKE
jgi:hypothetical protein